MHFSKHDGCKMNMLSLVQLWDVLLDMETRTAFQGKTYGFGKGKQEIIHFVYTSIT